MKATVRKTEAKFSPKASRYFFVFCCFLCAVNFFCIFTAPGIPVGCFAVTAVSLRVRLAGANADNGTAAGAFATNSNNAASLTNTNVSVPYTLTKGIMVAKDHASWQKITSAKKDAGRVNPEGFLPVKAETMVKDTRKQ